MSVDSDGDSMGIKGSMSGACNSSGASVPVFNNCEENFVGTNLNLACGSNAWPPDFNSSGKVDIVDVLLMKPHFGSTSPNPAYSQRFDLNTDGSVNILDVMRLRPFFGKSCLP